jgi:hypothetical protein
MYVCFDQSFLLSCFHFPLADNRPSPLPRLSIISSRNSSMPWPEPKRSWMCVFLLFFVAPLQSLGVFSCFLFFSRRPARNAPPCLLWSM